MRSLETLMRDDDRRPRWYTLDADGNPVPMWDFLSDPGFAAWWADRRNRGIHHTLLDSQGHILLDTDSIPTDELPYSERRWPDAIHVATDFLGLDHSDTLRKARRSSLRAWCLGCGTRTATNWL